MTARPARPAVHLCSVRCWLSCLFGVHRRITPEAKCLCCRTFSVNAAHALSRSARSEGLSLKWWEVR